MQWPHGCTTLQRAQSEQNAEQCEKNCDTTLSVEGHFFFIYINELKDFVAGNAYGRLKKMGTGREWVGAEN